MQVGEKLVLDWFKKCVTTDANLEDFFSDMNFYNCLVDDVINGVNFTSAKDKNNKNR